MNLPTITWRKPTAVQKAQEELQDAERSFLVAQSAAEYAQAMANYHRTRIMRLQRAITNGNITKES